MATLARYRSLEAPLGRLRRRRCASFARGPRTPRSLSLAAAAPLQLRLAAPCLGRGPRLPIRLPPKVGGSRRRSLPFGRSLSGVGGRRHQRKVRLPAGPLPRGRSAGVGSLGAWAPSRLEAHGVCRRLGRPSNGGRALAPSARGKFVFVARHCLPPRPRRPRWGPASTAVASAAPSAGAAHALRLGRVGARGCRRPLRGRGLCAPRPHMPQ